MLADELTELVAVVRCGSISSAASELALSQSALSRHIQRLEAMMGAAVLERGADGVRLTDAGRHAYEAGLDLVEVGERLRMRIAPGEPSR